MPKGVVRRIQWFSLASVIFLSLFRIGSASAQTATGTINGTLTDPQGLPMSGASVDVKNVDTGADFMFVSTQTGLYVAPLLQPGNYEVIAAKPGFNTVDQKSVVLLVGQTITVDIKMSLQTAEGTITVTSKLL